MTKVARLFASHNNGPSSHLLASIRHLCRSSNYKPRKLVEKENHFFNTLNPCNPHTRVITIPALPHTIPALPRR